MIVGFTGYARSGKDTAAKGLGWPRLAFADAVKSLLLQIDPYVACGTRLSTVVQMCGWEQAKANVEVRRLLQQLGGGARERLSGDVWIKKIEPLLADGSDIVITDVRYLNEGEMIRDYGGMVLRIERDGVGPASGHDSETELEQIDALRVKNNGTVGELHEKVVAIVYGSKMLGPRKRKWNNGSNDEIDASGSCRRPAPTRWPGRSEG
jgi:hypothetical protein